MLLRAEAHDFTSDVYSCLETKACVEGSLTAKNELTIATILTSGTYKILVLSDQPSPLESDVLPLSFQLEAFPIVQNEER